MVSIGALLTESTVGLTAHTPAHPDAALRDRVPTGAITTDLLNPGRFLADGQLVLTAMEWRREPADCATFVANVAAVSIAGIVASTERFSIPDAFVDACVESSIPLFTVPTNEALTSIAAEISAGSHRDEAARLVTSLTRSERLTSSDGVSTGRELNDVLRSFQESAGVASWVVTPFGRLVGGDEGIENAEALAGMPNVASELPEHHPAGRRMMRSALGASSLPVEVAGRTVFGIGPRTESRMSRWFFVLDGRLTELPLSTQDAVGELEDVIAIHRERRRRSLEPRRLMANSAVELLSAGAADEEVFDALERAGLPLNQSGDRARVVDARTVAGNSAAAGDTAPASASGAAAWTVAVLDTGRGEVATRDAVHSDLSEAPDTIVGRASGGVLVIISLTSRGIIQKLIGALQEAEVAFSSTVGLGLSEADDVTGIPGAFHLARQAASQAVSGVTGRVDPGPARLVIQDRAVASSILTLLQQAPTDEVRAFARGVLGPVDRYDAASNGQLRETLEMFLENACSWNVTARKMGLHLNTVRYRIGRVEELTGRNLSSVADRCDLYVALRTTY